MSSIEARTEPSTAARIGQEDPRWPDRYAEDIVAEQAGEELPR